MRGVAARRQLTDSLERGFNGKNDLDDGNPVLTFQDLLDYIEMKAQPESKDLDDDSLRSMSNSTIQALWRRLARVLGPTSGLLRRDDIDGAPLTLATMQEDVSVIDIQSIHDAHLQRFVIAAVLNQLVEWRSGPHAARHETFLVVIDELNRYAPRGASDAITKLFEYVASQMRSRGIILFGAQQQGSRVSDVVIENSQTRVLGRSGGQELADSIWRGFSEGDRKLALRLGPDEKVIVAPNFREALHVKVPRPPWAMRPEEATDIAAGVPRGRRARARRRRREGDAVAPTASARRSRWRCEMKILFSADWHLGYALGGANLRRGCRDQQRQLAQDRRLHRRARRRRAGDRGRRVRGAGARRGAGGGRRDDGGARRAAGARAAHRRRRREPRPRLLHGDGEHLARRARAAGGERIILRTRPGTADRRGERRARELRAAAVPDARALRAAAGRRGRRRAAQRAARQALHREDGGAAEGGGRSSGCRRCC